MLKVTDNTPRVTLLLTLNLYCPNDAEVRKLATSLEEIPGIDKALKTPIIDVEPPKLEAILENVFLTLVGQIETPCKHAMLIQIATGR